MKGITLCSECAYYSMKKHKCTRGAKDEGEPTARFYADCPLDDVASVVRCKDCKHWHEGTGWCDQHSYFDEDEWNMFDKDDFCSYGERKTENDTKCIDSISSKTKKAIEMMGKAVHSEEIEFDYGAED